MKVEELSQHGKTLKGLPEETMKRENRIRKAQKADTEMNRAANF